MVELKQVVFTLLMLTFFVFGQALEAKEAKSLTPYRIDGKVEIDGQLNEPFWKHAELAIDFIQQDPYPGKEAGMPSEVRVLYDDHALYIGARLYDPEPKKILRELSERNVIGNADHFEVVIDPYMDGINGYSFALTASGVQRDARMYGDVKDAAWDAVWESAVTIDSLGWVVEIKIPYSAIRFSSKEIQDWYINFGRNIRRTREQNWWNEINPSIDGVLQQSGTLKGLTSLEPPSRLSLYPFIAFNKDYNDLTGNNPWGWSGGMDLKYGISQAFTLDVTLIPDFSQTISDRDVLNLSPFEVVFDENRQFFTEGMEIFNRGDLFYTRRIGGASSYLNPIGLEPGDELLEAPVTPQLLNATKLSGRMLNGTGIGVFNAVTRREYARIRDENGEVRKERFVPLTNYNVVVADQSLRNNSSIALMNTNVWREGSAPFANATGTDFRFFTPDRKYVFRGYGHYSINQVANASNITGHQYHAELAKVSGKFRASVRYREISDEFDPNDLGLLLINNERRFYSQVGYFQFEPIGFINRFNTTLQFRYAQLYSSSDRTGLNVNWDASIYLKTWDAFFLHVSHHPRLIKDFYEPRRLDFKTFYRHPARTYGRFFYSSDFRRTLALNFRLEGTAYPEVDRSIYGWMIEPRVRVSDKFFIIASTNHVGFSKDEGYVLPNPAAPGFDKLEPGDIVFGSRDRKTIENNLNLRYIFSNRMSAVMRARHFYSRVDYLDFFKLLPNGSLAEVEYTGQLDGESRTLHDLNFHLFNVDLIYTWRFAPGSDLIFVWKNDIFSSRNEDADTYFRELRNLWSGPQRNSFTIKLVYYFDYQQIFRGI